MLKSICCTLAVLTVASPAIAGPEWAQSIYRGMVSYEISQGEGSIRLTCDPDKVFGDTSNGSLEIQFPEHNDARRIAVLAASGEQAGFDVINGLVSEHTADAEEWDKMVSILRAGGDYAFVAPNDVIQLEGVPALPDLDC